MKIIGMFRFIVLLQMTALQNTYAAEPALEIQIAVNQDSLKTSYFKEKNVFFTDTNIKNISSENQVIVIWTQQGWSWLSDNSNITPGTEALKNAPATITLKPGEKYKGSVETFLNAKAGQTTTYRFGFFPKADLPISDQPLFATVHAREIIWSNSVTAPLN